MKLKLHKLLVFTAFGLLLAHNFIPHHHHHDRTGSELEHLHHESDDHHHHLPLAFFHVDEAYLFQSFKLKLAPHPAIAAIIPTVPVFEKIVETKASGFISNPSGHPPLPPFFSSFSFRGPPTV